MAQARPLLASTTATPLFRNEASIARTRIKSASDQAKQKKNAPHAAKNQANHPKPALMRQCRDRGDGNRDLEHGNAASVNLVLVKIALRLCFLALGFRLDRKS